MQEIYEELQSTVGGELTCFFPVGAIKQSSTFHIAQDSNLLLEIQRLKEKFPAWWYFEAHCNSHLSAIEQVCKDVEMVVSNLNQTFSHFIHTLSKRVQK